MSDALLTHRDGPLFRITLNRPDKLNALSVALLGELLDACAAAEDPAIRVVILTAAGRAFSAGADLHDPAREDPVETRLTRLYNPLVQRITNLPKPVLCAVNGICAGAGMNLALACDIILAARSATFIQAFARIGLMPDAGGTFFLPRAIGTPRALAAALLADDIQADTAAAWGLIHKTVPDEDLTAETDRLANRLACGPTAAYAAIKQAFHHGQPTLTDQLALEARLQGQLSHTADFTEGTTAFATRRPAVFVGR